MPSGYLTWPIMGLGESQGNSDRVPDDFTYYDRYVRQPRTWVISREGKETQVLCVAPDVLVEGSRVPEGEWPPAGTSGARREGMGMGMAGVVIGVVGAVLMM